MDVRSEPCGEHMLKKSRVQIILFFVALSVFFMPVPSYAALCDDMDVRKMAEQALDVMEQSGGGSDSTSGYAAANVYTSKKWLITCAAGNGIKNLSGAAAFLQQESTIARYSNLVAQGTGASTDSSRQALKDIGQALERLSQSSAFRESIFDRMRIVGLYILVIGFLITIGIKSYNIITSSEHESVSEFICLCFRFISFIMLIWFMRPAVYYGMEMSSLVAKMVTGSNLNVSITGGSTGGGSVFHKGDTVYNFFTKSNIVISSPFQASRDLFNTGTSKVHHGVDHAFPMGTPLYMPFNGTIKCGKNVGGYGNYATVTEEDKNITYRLGHLSECRDNSYDGIAYRVKAGEKIGATGNSGRSTGPHLHTEVIIGTGQRVDPDAYMYSVNGRTLPGSTDVITEDSGTVNTAGGAVYQATGGDVTQAAELYSQLMNLKQAALNPVSLSDIVSQGWQYLFSSVAIWLMSLANRIIIFVLLILADVMMAITLSFGPLIIGLSIIPMFEGYLSNWIKGYVTFLFYQPLAAVFSVLCFVIGAISLDAGFMAFMILSICYVVGCFNIPNIANGLSTAVLASAAIGLSMLPAGGAMLGLRGVTKAAGAGVTAGKAKLSGSSQSRGGRISKTAALILASIMLLMSAVAASARDYTPEEIKSILNVMERRTYPTKEAYQAVEKHYLRQDVTPGAENENGYIYNKEDNSQAGLVSGTFNTSYSNTLDLPLVKFILGDGQNGTTIDGVRVYEMSYMGRFHKPPSEATATEMAELFGVEAANSQHVDLYSKGEQVNRFLESSRDAIQHKVMGIVPFYILCIMFMFQLARIAYLRVADINTGDKIQLLQPLVRFIFYLMLIYFFKYWTASLITFSNYVSNALVPLSAQEALMEGITVKSLSVSLTNSFTGLLVGIFRCITYMSIKILLISRDMFLTIMLIIGPACIAFGYYTAYKGSDPLHGFLKGWFENFIKLLFWGPFAAVMIYCLGILSVLTAFDLISVTGVAITAMAFLLSAKNIPNLADRMSGVALAGLLTAVSPYLKSGMIMMYAGGRSAMAGGFWAASMLRHGGMGGLMSSLGTLFSGKRGNSTNFGFNGGGAGPSGPSTGSGPDDDGPVRSKSTNNFLDADDKKGASEKAQDFSSKSSVPKDINGTSSILGHLYDPKSFANKLNDSGKGWLYDAVSSISAEGRGDELVRVGKNGAVFDIDPNTESGLSNLKRLGITKPISAGQTAALTIALGLAKIKSLNKDLANGDISQSDFDEQFEVLRSHMTEIGGSMGSLSPEEINTAASVGRISDITGSRVVKQREVSELIASAVNKAGGANTPYGRLIGANAQSEKLEELIFTKNPGFFEMAPGSEEGINGLAEAGLSRPTDKNESLIFSAAVGAAAGAYITRARNTGNMTPEEAGEYSAKVHRYLNNMVTQYSDNDAVETGPVGVGSPVLSSPRPHVETTFDEQPTGKIHPEQKHRVVYEPTEGNIQDIAEPMVEIQRHVADEHIDSVYDDASRSENIVLNSETGEKAANPGIAKTVFKGAEFAVKDLYSTYEKNKENVGREEPVLQEYEHLDYAGPATAAAPVPDLEAEADNIILNNEAGESKAAVAKKEKPLITKTVFRGAESAVQDLFNTYDKNKEHVGGGGPGLHYEGLLKENSSDEEN